MPGAELQLAAYGKQDLELTGKPQISYFCSVFKRYTNFAIENIEEVLIGNPIFGSKSHVKLGRYGDLVGKIYLQIDLPALNPSNDPSFALSWINSIGHAIIKKISIEIGGIIIDEQYGMWLEIWNELTLPAEKKWGYYNMIGKHDYFNVTMQQDRLRLRIPLQFWFCKNIGLALPTIALQNMDVRLIVEFHKFDELWVSSTGDLSMYHDVFTRAKKTPEQYFQIIEALCYVDYIYLEDNERRWFVNTRHKYLIDQIHHNFISTNLTSIDNIIQLYFNHPVKELIWVIRDCINFTKVSGGGNDMFNFSDKLLYLGLPLDDPMINSIIYIEGKYRFWPPRDGRYFREIEPYKYHHNIPNNFIYVYSFSLEADSNKPTGTCDFSMLDNIQLNIKIKDTLIDPQINIFAPNYNILIIEGGMAGLRYND